MPDASLISVAETDPMMVPEEKVGVWARRIVTETTQKHMAARVACETGIVIAANIVSLAAKTNGNRFGIPLFTVRVD